jgi:hypothetical protein
MDKVTEGVSENEMTVYKLFYRQINGPEILSLYQSPYGPNVFSTTVYSFGVYKYAPIHGYFTCSRDLDLQVLVIGYHAYLTVTYANMYYKSLGNLTNTLASKEYKPSMYQLTIPKNTKIFYDGVNLTYSDVIAAQMLLNPVFIK